MMTTKIIEQLAGICQGFSTTEPDSILVKFPRLSKSGWKTKTVKQKCFDPRDRRVLGAGCYIEYIKVETHPEADHKEFYWLRRKNNRVVKCQ